LPKEPRYARLNAKKFRHVLDNLLNNALKFTPTGGTIYAGRARASQLQFVVQDTGISIPGKLHA